MIGPMVTSTVAAWIDCDIRTLVERTSRRDHRPLLRSGDPEEILSLLESSLPFRLSLQDVVQEFQYCAKNRQRGAPRRRNPGSFLFHELGDIPGNNVRILLPSDLL